MRQLSVSSFVDSRRIDIWLLIVSAKPRKNCGERSEKICCDCVENWWSLNADLCKSDVVSLEI